MERATTRPSCVLLTFLLVATPLASLRPSGDRVPAEFRQEPYALDARGERPVGSQALYLEGRDTGLRFPPEWRAWARANRRGDVAGFAVYPFSGAYSGRCVRTFVRPRGGPTLLIPNPDPKRFSDLVYLNLDEKGRVLTLAVQRFFGPMLDNPTYGVPHAYLWANGALADVGPAETARWTPRGTVAGVYWVTEGAVPINRAATDVRRWLRHFEWNSTSVEEYDIASEPHPSPLSSDQG